MLARVPVLLALMTSAGVAAAPLPTAHWWEKVTVTVAGKGAEPSCTFTSSREAAKACDVEAPAGALASAAPDSGQKMQITFERRFAPGASTADTDIAAGEMLLGGQVMKLAIDTDGKVASCAVVERSGEMATDYGCAEARAERFSAGEGREGLLTILVYAHQEQVA